MFRLILKTAFVATGGILLLFFMGYFFFYYQEKPTPDVLLKPVADMQKQTKLLVFSPHCDDEALGCAAMIHDVMQAGGQVLVVILTNGDGFTFAAEDQFHRLFLTSTDYINSGYARQKESLQALRLLGVTENQVLFLGYPDRGLNAIWSHNWDTDRPYRSKFTASDHSPYVNSYQTNAPYSGQTLLGNLESIIKEFQPTIVLSPHPGDEHHDHSATWAFVITALAALNDRGLLTWPTVYTYLIHRGDFPLPHGYKPASPLLPPRPLSHTQTDNWYARQINPDTRNLKEQAIKEYSSQIRIPVMSALLHSFIRTNELFEIAQIPVFEAVPSSTDLSVPDAWDTQKAILINPPGLNPLGALEHEARIASVYGCIQGSYIWLRFYIPDFSERKNEYQLSLIGFLLQGDQLLREVGTFTFSTTNTDLPQEDIVRYRDAVTVKISSIHTLPDFFFIQITTKDRFGATIDQTVWQPCLVRH